MKKWTREGTLQYVHILYCIIMCRVMWLVQYAADPDLQTLAAVI